MAVRCGLSTFLGIAGIVAIVIGLLYLLVPQWLPNLLQGGAHTGHHVPRSIVYLVIGAACVLMAWMIRARQPAAGARKSP
jgi:hypothetical protein